MLFDLSYESKQYQNSLSTLSKGKNEHTTGKHESFQNHLRSHRIRCFGNCLCRVIAKLADLYSSKQQIFFNTDLHADQHTDKYTYTDQYADQHTDKYTYTD